MEIARDFVEEKERVKDSARYRGLFQKERRKMCTRVQHATSRTHARTKCVLYVPA